MYDIAKGKVGVFADYETERVHQLAELKAGDFLGEMGMIEVYPRSATAVALSDQLVLSELGEADLHAYFHDDPARLLQLMRQLSARIRETTRKYTDLCGTLSRQRKAEAQGEEQPELLREMDRYAEFYSTHWADLP